MGERERKEIGARLKLAREHAGHESAAAAARALKLHHQNVRDQEAGRRGMDPAQLAFYAKAYSVSIEWLTTGRGAMLETAPEPDAEIIDIWSRIPETNREAARRMLEALQKKDRA